MWCPGEPNDVVGLAEADAIRFEQLVVLAFTFRLPRLQFQKRLGIGPTPKTERSLTIGPHFYSLRAKTRGSKDGSGLIIDKALQNRFKAFGFEKIIGRAFDGSEIISRVFSTLTWLFQSRIEPQLESAVVKTAIACETLFIFSESEPLSRSLSERMAFMLGRSSDDRRYISGFVKRGCMTSAVVSFMEAKRNTNIFRRILLQLADRLILACCLTIGSNPHLWRTAEDLRKWFEEVRWGYAVDMPEIPLSTRVYKSMLADAQLMEA